MHNLTYLHFGPLPKRVPCCTDIIPVFLNVSSSYHSMLRELQGPALILETDTSVNLAGIAFMETRSLVQLENNLAPDVYST